MKQAIKKLFIKVSSIGNYLWFVKVFGKKGDLNLKQANVFIFFELLAKGPVNFIQIGANDGAKNDPIHEYIKKYKWIGILVEPLPEFFKRLQENYKGQDQLTFENVGIGDKDGELNFYFMPPEYNEPDWLQQIGTFDRHSIEFNLNAYPQLISKIATEKKPLMSWKTLLEKNKVQKIDLLLIDAEGFEYVILKQMDDYPVKPSYVFFEWGCLEKETLDLLLAFLTKRNYQIYSCGSDILAVLNK
ncbi:MAG TPA: FkbM family methyltransferase [Puia sp.]|nr:FkbM family methyltransferase [Puia sp.]